MDILEVNEYLNAASDALQDDPEYFHWIQALGNARKQALDECDCYTDKVEGCLWQVYVRQVKYILENIGKIDKAIAEAEKEFSETGEYVDAKEAFDDLRDEYDIDTLNPRPNPYAKELVKELDDAVEKSEREGWVDEEAILIDEGLDDYESGKVVDGKGSLKRLKGKHELGCSDVEKKLDEADHYAETHSKRLSHEEVFSQARVTFRQIVEKTVTVDGSDMATIYKNIETLKANPDEIDFDKDCDGIVIEARLNP